jgi:hypothetical protein
MPTPITFKFPSLEDIEARMRAEDAAVEVAKNEVSPEIPLSIPTVHLNGTHVADLVAQYRDAAAAIREAMEKLAAATPHGRDYYVQGPDTYLKARAEHDARMSALRKVSEELRTIAIAVARQAPRAVRAPK